MNFSLLPFIGERYKIPVLISLVFSLAVLVLQDVTSWWLAILTFVGGVIAVLILDLEYIAHAFYISPNEPLSEELRIVSKSKSLKNIFSFIREKEYNFSEMSIHSALFQVMLNFLGFYIVTARVNSFVQSLILTLLGCLLYEQIIEFLKTGTLKRWFWIYKGETNSQFFKNYIGFATILLFAMFFFL